MTWVAYRSRRPRRYFILFMIVLLISKEQLPIWPYRNTFSGLLVGASKLVQEGSPDIMLLTGIVLTGVGPLVDCYVPVRLR